MPKETISNSKAGDCVVVYSIATGRVRSVLTSNRNDEIKEIEKKSGEASLLLSSAQVQSLYAAASDEKKRSLDPLQDHVNTVTGKAPHGDRYVVIDKDGVIVNAIIADPACGDALPGCELVQHDSADTRWTYKGGEFIPPAAPPPKPPGWRDD